MCQTMSAKSYGNFVRASSPRTVPVHELKISGEEARRLYLEEVKDVGDPEPAYNYTTSHKKVERTTQEERNRPKLDVDATDLSEKALFLSAQNNDVHTLKCIIDSSPDKLNVRDEFGWSPLMIACKANSVEVVKELLKRNADMEIRDKAGNCARSLVIQNRNIALVQLLLSNKSNTPKEFRNDKKHKSVRLKEEFRCDICKKTYPDKHEHLSSTLHNINASKGKKIPTAYKIPLSNKGYQMMLRNGWDKEAGLGPDGSGKKYPIKTVQKKDRKGLGHEKVKPLVEEQDTVKHLSKKLFAKEYRRNRQMEIDFRRQFY